jgi:hypothetical protein
MNKSTLLLVKAQAQLVISRIDKVLDELEKTSYPSHKLTASVRRSSMELTRVLTDLRQNR